VAGGFSWMTECAGAPGEEADVVVGCELVGGV